MAYHTGRRNRERTQERQSQPQSNRDAPSVVTSVVQNSAGRFVQQQPVNREEVEQEVQTQEQTNAEQMVQQMMMAGASAESMYQQTQAAQEETQEQSPIELSGTVFMPSPSSNTWVVQTINGDANLIEAGQNITLVQQGQSQSFVIQSMVGNTIILDESVPNQNIGSTLDFLITIEPPQETQQETQAQTLSELTGTLIMPTPDASLWSVQSVNNNALAQQVQVGMNVTLLQFGQTQNFTIQSISGNTITFTESVPNQNIGSTVEFFITAPPETIVTNPPEPMPTSPPAGVTAINQMSGTLSPLEQWVWQGLSDGWVEYVPPPPPPPPLPAPPPPPSDFRFEITQRFYPGVNFRTFYGLESYRDVLEDFVQENNIEFDNWQDYWPSSPSDYQQEVPRANRTRNYLINNIFQGLPLTKISVLKDDGTTGKFFQPADPAMPGMPDLPVNANMRLDVIQSGFTYIVEMGNEQPYYDVTYKGLEPPFIPRRYETQPFEEVPASLPNAYQNRYQNEWAPEFENADIPENQFCATCRFYEPDGGYCNKWNAKVRISYWCAAWQQLIYPEAQPNEFTQFLRTRDASNASTNISLYNFFHDRVKFPTEFSGTIIPTELRGEPNLNNFLAPFDALFSTYGAVLIGDYLRRVVDSGNAFDYGDSALDLIFPTPGVFIQAIDFINKGGLNANFSKEPAGYDLRVQAKVSYLFTQRPSSNLESFYPNQIRINLLGNWFGTVANVMSQMLFTNVKYAYTPKFNNQSTHAVWFDVRTTPLRGKGEFNIDILKQSTMERFIKLANDPTREVKLNQDSSFKFLSWVARRAPYHPEMQELYNVMLDAEEYSVDNEAFMAALNNCLDLQFPDDPEPANMPLNSNLIDLQPPNNFWERNSVQNGNGDGEGDSGGSTEEEGGGY